MDWWEDIKTEDNIVLLVFKVAHDGHRRIVMEREVQKWMEEKSGKITCPPYYGFGWLSLRGKTLFTMGLDDFLGWCSPSFFGGIPKEEHPFLSEEGKRVVLDVINEPKKKKRKLKRTKPKRVLKRKIKLR